MKSQDDKVQLEAESFYSFSDKKTGLLNNLKRTVFTSISVTPSPNKYFKEDTISVPDIDFSTSSQSTTPTGTTISMSSKNNIYIQDYQQGSKESIGMTRFPVFSRGKSSIITIPKETILESKISINKANYIIIFLYFCIGKNRHCIKDKKSNTISGGKLIMSGNRTSTSVSSKTVNFNFNFTNEGENRIDSRNEKENNRTQNFNTPSKKAFAEINELIHSQKKKFREDEEVSLELEDFTLGDSIENQNQNSANLNTPHSPQEVRKQSTKSAIQKELKLLTNTQDIRDFHEYTEDCMKSLKRIIPDLQSQQPNRIKLEEKYIKQITSGEKKLAVFDLDETLVHREFENYDKCDKVIEVTMPGGEVVKIGMYIRPLLLQSLLEISQDYILVLFTASQQIYADKVMELIDPDNSLFVKRLYRDSCMKASLDGGTIYIKDISIFQDIPLEKIIIIDNSVLSFCNQLDNGIPILPFYQNKEDVELKDLVEYLRHTALVNDVRVQNRTIIGLGRYYNEEEINQLSESFSSSDEVEVDTNKVKKEEVIILHQNCVYNTSNSSRYTLTELSQSELSDNRGDSDINQKELLMYLEVFQDKYKKLYGKK